jgi:D-arabinose 1-dehydrogenase-like Zn-dependent alcohol dehydrogenase
MVDIIIVLVVRGHAVAQLVEALLRNGRLQLLGHVERIPGETAVRLGV